MAEAPRWLVVVDPARPNLYALLHRRLTAQACVLLDRRTQGEAAPPPVERRHPMTSGEAVRWQTLGYQVAATAPTDSAAAEDLRVEVDQLARLGLLVWRDPGVPPGSPDGRRSRSRTGALDGGGLRGLAAARPRPAVRNRPDVNKPGEGGRGERPPVAGQEPLGRESSGEAPQREP